MILFFSLLAALLLFSGVACVLDYKTNKATTEAVFSGRYNRILAIVFLSVLFFLSAFRGNTIGNDTLSYIGIFNAIGKGGLNAVINLRYEVGYALLNLLIYKTTGSVQVLFIITSAFIYLGVGYFILSESKNIPLSLLIFYTLFFAFELSAVRQGLALTCGLLAFSAAKKDKTVLSIGMVALATSFHLTAAVLIIIPFSNRIKFSPKLALIIAFVTVVSVWGRLIPTIGALLFPSYKSYFNSVYAGTGLLAISLTLLRSLYFYFIVEIVYNENHSILPASFENNVYPLLMFAPVILSAFALTMNLFDRVSYYFVILLLAILPSAINKIKDDYYRGMAIAVTAVFLTSFFILVLVIRPEWYNLYPYRFFWEKG